MTRTIWKFDLHDAYAAAEVAQATPVLVLELPVGAEPLDVQVQSERPVLWVDLDPAERRSTHYFAIVGSGQPVPGFVDEWVATWQEPPFAWHLFSVDPVLYESRGADEGGAS